MKDVISMWIITMFLLPILGFLFGLGFWSTAPKIKEPQEYLKVEVKEMPYLQGHTTIKEAK